MPGTHRYPKHARYRGEARTRLGIVTICNLGQDTPITAHVPLHHSDDSPWIVNWQNRLETAGYRVRTSAWYILAYKGDVDITRLITIEVRWRG